MLRGEASPPPPRRVMERRSAEVASHRPSLLRGTAGIRRALFANDDAIAEGLIAWLGGPGPCRASVTFLTPPPPSPPPPPRARQA